MTEINKRLCKGPCGQIKTRALAGKFPDGKNKIWVDDSNNKWNGNYCYECTKDRLKNVMKEKRSKVEVTGDNADGQKI